MQVKILDRVFAYENEPAALEMIFAKINEFLEDTGLIFSHLKVDDTEVYTDYYNYLKKRIDRVELVEVEVRTVTEILQDALLTAEEYLERALPETESLAGEFYQGPSGETWTKFQQLLEGVEWLNQLLETIDQNKLKPENWRSEEHTSELQSRPHLVCRLLLEKKKTKITWRIRPNLSPSAAIVRQYHRFVTSPAGKP